MRLFLVTLCIAGIVSSPHGTGDRVLSTSRTEVSVGVPLNGSSTPNVLILLADDLGVDMIGAYAEGGDLPATPNVDSLAGSGVMFRNAWSHPVCSPTRASILTGRYSFRNGIGFIIDSTGVALRASELTLPEMLDAGASGYDHAAFGKWHLSNDENGGLLAPNLAGFGHFSGTSCSLVTPETYFNWPHITDGVAVTETLYEPEVIVDEAIAWMNAREQPFLCYLPFNLPHTPYHRPPDHLHSVDFTGVDPNPVIEPRPYYKAMVEAMDTLIGRILTTVDPAVLANTVILFVGDNGTPISVTAAPFLPPHAKTTVFEGGVNVPFIVSGPPVQMPGTESAALVHTVDIFATIAEAAGVDLETVAPSTTLDAISLYPYLQDPATPSLRNTIYTETFYPNGSPPEGPVDYLCNPQMPSLIGGGGLHHTELDRGQELVCQPNLGYAGPGGSQLRICGPTLHELSTTNLTIGGGPPDAMTLLLWGNGFDPTPFGAGALVPSADPYGAFKIVQLDATGRYSEPFPHQLGLESMYYQAAITDGSLPGGYSITNAVRARSLLHRGAIRNQQYKLIFDAYTCEEALYDLVADPFEVTDLLLGTLTPDQQLNYTSLSDELLLLTGY